jgi:hypothetical protein
MTPPGRNPFVTQHPTHDTSRARHPATWLLALLSLLLLAGCTDALGSDDSATGANDTLLPMTLTTWMYTPGASAATGDPVGIAHVSISPMQPGENDLTIALTDLAGSPLALAGDASLELTHRALAPDAEPETLVPAHDAGETATWSVEALDLPEQAWYALDLVLVEDGQAAAIGSVYALLPDPSVHGPEALDLPASDADAEALYERALASYASWDTGKWRESLGSGADVLVVTEFTVAPHDSGHPAMASRSRYAGSFRDKSDGSPPAAPRHDFAHRIVVGERTWSREETGAWTETRGLGASGFPERAEIYEGATNVRFGGTETIDGVETRIVTFYLPQKDGQAQAWFAWWIDPETGNPLRMAMIAKMHFMVWDFHDIDVPATIEPPPAREVATPAPN